MNFFSINNQQSTINNPSQRLVAFTLIEMLITISIFLILSSLSLAGYVRLNERQGLLTSGQTLKNIMRDAQSRSFNGEMDCGSCGGCSLSTAFPFVGWFVDFTPGARKIYGQCGSSIFSEKTINIAAEITIVPHLTPVTKLLFQYNPPGVDQKATICLSKSSLSGSYYVIRVNYAGDISDEGLTSSCTP